MIDLYAIIIDNDDDLFHQSQQLTLVEGHQFSKLMARKIKKIYIMKQSQKVLKTKKFKKIIENNDDVKVRHYIRIILVS